MARHDSSNMNFGSPIILNFPDGTAYIVLTDNSRTMRDVFDDLTPVRHRMHSLDECVDPTYCPQIPADKFV
jgi:hypothetical protein